MTFKRRLQIYIYLHKFVHDHCMKQINKSFMSRHIHYLSYILVQGSVILTISFFSYFLTAYLENINAFNASCHLFNNRTRTRPNVWWVPLETFLSTITCFLLESENSANHSSVNDPRQCFLIAIIVCVYVSSNCFCIAVIHAVHVHVVTRNRDLLRKKCLMSYMPLQELSISHLNIKKSFAGK